MLVAAVGGGLWRYRHQPAVHPQEEVFSGNYGVPVNHDGVFGILALIFWSLIWVVSIKYMLFVLRADNQGEGGIMALTALARRGGGAVSAAAGGAGDSRPDRCGAVLWRQHDHPGDFRSCRRWKAWSWHSMGWSTGSCRWRWSCWWGCS